jgi:caa(3)-type oxidase subunit IV
MANTHDAEGGHVHPVQPYLVVFGALAGFTLVSFLANTAYRSDVISLLASFVIILGVAVVKAVLVATYFMHLKQDWTKLYIMIIPGLILATLLVIVLMPDIVLVWHHQ